MTNENTQLELFESEKKSTQNKDQVKLDASWRDWQADWPMWKRPDSQFTQFSHNEWVKEKKEIIYDTLSYTQSEEYDRQKRKDIA